MQGRYTVALASLFILFFAFIAVGCGSGGGGAENKGGYVGKTDQAVMTADNVREFAFAANEALKFAMNRKSAPFSEPVESGISYEGSCGGTIIMNLQETYDEGTGLGTQFKTIVADNYCNFDNIDAPQTNGAVWSGSWTMQRSYGADFDQILSTFAGVTLEMGEGEWIIHADGTVKYDTPNPDAIDPFGATDVRVVDMYFRTEYQGALSEYLLQVTTTEEEVPDTDPSRQVTGRVYVGEYGFAELSAVGTYIPNLDGDVLWEPLTRYLITSGLFLFNETEARLTIQGILDGNWIMQYLIELPDVEPGSWNELGLFDAYWNLIS